MWLAHGCSGLHWPGGSLLPLGGTFGPIGDPHRHTVEERTDRGC
jgi:hypothetical protein